METKLIKIGKLRIYITDHPMKSKAAKSRNKAERSLKHLQVARTIAEKNICECELCGEKEKKLQLHHLFAVSIWPEKALEPENTMLVCETCHQRIHNNPFLWCELIAERMPERGGKGTENKDELLTFNF